MPRFLLLLLLFLPVSVWAACNATQRNTADLAFHGTALEIGSPSVDGSIEVLFAIHTIHFGVPSYMKHVIIHVGGRDQINTGKSYEVLAQSRASILHILPCVLGKHAGAPVVSAPRTHGYVQDGDDVSPVPYNPGRDVTVEAGDAVGRYYEQERVMEYNPNFIPGRGGHAETRSVAEVRKLAKEMRENRGRLRAIPANTKPKRPVWIPPVVLKPASAVMRHAGGRASLSATTPMSSAVAAKQPRVKPKPRPVPTPIARHRPTPSKPKPRPTSIIPKPPTPPVVAVTASTPNAIRTPAARPQKEITTPRVHNADIQDIPGILRQDTPLRTSTHSVPQPLMAEAHPLPDPARDEMVRLLKKDSPPALGTHMQDTASLGRPAQPPRAPVARHKPPHPVPTHALTQPSEATARETKDRRDLIGVLNKEGGVLEVRVDPTKRKYSLFELLQKRYGGTVPKDTPKTTAILKESEKQDNSAVAPEKSNVENVRKQPRVAPFISPNTAIQPPVQRAPLAVQRPTPSKEAAPFQPPSQPHPDGHMEQNMHGKIHPPIAPPAPAPRDVRRPTPSLGASPPARVAPTAVTTPHVTLPDLPDLPPFADE